LYVCVFVQDLNFCPYEDILGLAHTTGFNSIVRLTFLASCNMNRQARMFFSSFPHSGPCVATVFFLLWWRFSSDDLFFFYMHGLLLYANLSLSLRLCLVRVSPTLIRLKLTFLRRESNVKNPKCDSYWISCSPI
jgi:hypothetical protein